MEFTIILPPTLDLLPDNTVTTDIKDMYSLNDECVLQIVFNYNTIYIDYISESGIDILNHFGYGGKNHTFNGMDGGEFIEIQYEIAKFLGIECLDENIPQYYKPNPKIICVEPEIIKMLCDDLFYN